MFFPTHSFSIFDLVKTVMPFSRFTEKIPRERFDDILESAEILIKYFGYIDRERLIADKFKKWKYQYRGRFDYEHIIPISTEARQKLSRINQRQSGRQ
jgi:tRNA uridine 5-carboxymethylaminomethyl modification enzyme